MILLFQYNCLSVSLELGINIIIELLKGTFFCHFVSLLFNLI